MMISFILHVFVYIGFWTIQPSHGLQYMMLTSNKAGNSEIPDLTCKDYTYHSSPFMRATVAEYRRLGTCQGNVVRLGKWYRFKSTARRISPNRCPKPKYDVNILNRTDWLLNIPSKGIKSVILPPRVCLVDSDGSCCYAKWENIAWSVRMCPGDHGHFYIFYANPFSVNCQKNGKPDIQFAQTSEYFPIGENTQENKDWLHKVQLITLRIILATIPLSLFFVGIVTTYKYYQHKVNQKKIAEAAQTMEECTPIAKSMWAYRMEVHHLPVYDTEFEQFIEETFESVPWIVGWEQLINDGNRFVTVFVSRHVKFIEAEREIRRALRPCRNIQLSIYRCLQAKVRYHGNGSEENDAKAARKNTINLDIGLDVVRRVQVDGKNGYTKIGAFFTITKTDGSTMPCLFTACEGLELGDYCDILIDKKLYQVGPTIAKIDRVYENTVLGRSYNMYYDGMFMGLDTSRLTSGNFAFNEDLGNHVNIDMPKKPWVMAKRELKGQVTRIKKYFTRNDYGWLRSTKFRFKERKSGLFITNAIFFSKTPEPKQAECMTDEGDCGSLIGTIPTALLPYSSIFACVFGACQLHVENELGVEVEWSYTLAYPMYDFFDMLKQENPDIAEITLA